MTSEERLVTVGRVGRPHGLDGRFRVDAPDPALAAGTTVIVAGDEYVVERCGGTAERPLVKLRGVSDRDAAVLLRGERLLMREADAPLAEREWLAADLVGCLVPGFGRVARVVGGPSCDVLELDDGTLVPFVADAVKSIDVARRRIEVDEAFLGRAEAAR